MAKYSWLEFFKAQWTPMLPVINADLTGQTVIVTGANGGLGYSLVKHFSKMNPEKIILACRNRKKADEAIEKLKKETGYVKYEVRILDQSSFAGVSAFVDELEKDNVRIDVFVANAGVMLYEFGESKDGWDMTYQVNHLSTALLAIRLLPLLHKSAREHGITPRLTFINSILHFFVKIDEDLREDPRGIIHALSARDWKQSPGGQRYFYSKLLSLLFVRALNAHLAPQTPLVVNAVHPGLCKSNLGEGRKFPANVLFGLLNLVAARTEDQGASVMAWAALAGTAGEQSADLRDSLKGAYVTDKRVGEPSDFVISEDGVKSQAKIWDETIDVLKKADPKVAGLVDEYLTHAA